MMTKKLNDGWAGSRARAEEQSPPVYSRKRKAKKQPRLPPYISDGGEEL